MEEAELIKAYLEHRGWKKAERRGRETKYALFYNGRIINLILKDEITKDEYKRIVSALSEIEEDKERYIEEQIQSMRLCAV